MQSNEKKVNNAWEKLGRDIHNELYTLQSLLRVIDVATEHISESDDDFAHLSNAMHDCAGRFDAWIMDMQSKLEDLKIPANI